MLNGRNRCKKSDFSLKGNVSTMLQLLTIKCLMKLLTCKIISGQLTSKSFEFFGSLFSHLVQFLQKSLIHKLRVLLETVAKQSIWQFSWFAEYLIIKLGSLRHIYKKSQWNSYVVWPYCEHHFKPCSRCWCKAAVLLRISNYGF